MPGYLWVIFAVAGLFALVNVVARFSRMRSVQKVHCAEKNQVVEIAFDRRLGPTWGPGRKMDVLSCSAFADPRAVSCAKGCLANPRL